MIGWAFGTQNAGYLSVISVLGFRDLGFRVEGLRLTSVFRVYSTFQV